MRLNEAKNAFGNVDNRSQSEPASIPVPMAKDESFVKVERAVPSASASIFDMIAAKKNRNQRR